jgi:hypothetical protein
MDIHELSQNSQIDLKDSYLKLEKKCDGLSEMIDTLIKQLELKEDEILQLKKALSQSIPNSGQAINLILSDEEFIADIQLNKLKDSARVRQLTLDEIRMFDLLVKNKRLAQGNATTIDGQVKSPKQLSQTELLTLASKKI